MENKIKDFDPTRINCNFHPKNKLQTIDLSSKAHQRLLCAHCPTENHTGLWHIKEVLSKQAIDKLIKNLLMLYQDELTNSSKNNANVEIDALFGELIELIASLRAKIREKISNIPRIPMDKEALQQVERLQAALVEKLVMFANDPNQLNEFQEIESYTKIFNFLANFVKELEAQKQNIIQSEKAIVQSAKERLYPIKKDIMRWIENPDTYEQLKQSDKTLASGQSTPGKSSPKSSRNHIKDFPEKHDARSEKYSSQHSEQLVRPPDNTPVKDTDIRQEYVSFGEQSPNKNDSYQRNQVFESPASEKSFGSLNLKYRKESAEFEEEEKQLGPSNNTNVIDAESYDNMSTKLAGAKIVKEIRDCESIKTFLNGPDENLNEIKSLELKNQFIEIEDAGVTEIMGRLNKLQDLVSLSLNFTASAQITDASVSYLAQQLPSFSSLVAFSLKLSGCLKLTDKSLLDLMVNITQLTKLESLEIYLSGCQLVTDAGVVQIAAGANKLATLKKLVVDVSLCNSSHNFAITDSGLSEFAVQLAQSHSLESLTLYASSSNISAHPLTDQGLTDFSHNIGQVAQLQSLKLDFTWCINFTDKGIQSMAKNLSNLKNLSILKIDLSWCKALTSKSATYLSTAFAQIRGLSTLYLCFSYSRNINDDALREISAKLLAKLPHLTYLRLDFTWCSNISDRGITALTEALSNHAKLKGLSLRFNSSFFISDVGLIEIGKCLVTLKHLQNLTLYLTQCSQIGDAGHIFLAKQLSARIQRLGLYFSYCKKITEESINQLSANLQKISSLRGLTLDYTGCSKISEKSIVNIKQAMEKMDQLNGAITYNFEEKDKGSKKSHRKNLPSATKVKKQEYLHT